MLGFPEGAAFAPYGFARNLSSVDQKLHVLVNYMDKSGPHSVPLPDETLRAGEARDLSLAKLLQLPFQDGAANLLFTVDSGCDSMLLTTGSVDATGNYVFAVDPVSVGKSGSKSSVYWQVGNGVSTMYSLWNPTPEPEDILVTVEFDPEGTYKVPVHLDGNASTMLDLMDLMVAGKPDPDGHVIPLGTRNGSLLISSPKNDLREFINVVVSGGTYNPLTGTCATTCQTCNGETYSEVDPGSFDISVGHDDQMAFILTDNLGNRYDYTNSANWSTNNSSVMTAQTGGLVTGVGAGTAVVSALLLNAVAVYTPQLCNDVPCPSSPA